VIGVQKIASVGENCKGTQHRTKLQGRGTFYLRLAMVVKHRFCSKFAKGYCGIEPKQFWGWGRQRGEKRNASAQIMAQSEQQQITSNK
jgi:hypothetical protein